MKPVILLKCFSFIIFFTTLLPVTHVTAKTAGGIDADSNTITLALSQEPRSLNSLTAESVSYTAQLMVHLQEGLMRYDGRRRLVGGVAERWIVDSQSIHFWLRPDARWENGDPVQAQDFVFAWQQLVNPATGSPSAMLASPIKNAAAILRGELESDSLGVRAVSDTELLISLEHPCGWCLKLMTNSIFYPVNQRFYNKTGEAYGTSPATQLSNGAFKLATWQRGKQIHLEKNHHYWGRDRVYPDRINFDYIGSDAKTVFNLFRSGEIAVAGLDRETIKDSLDLGYRLKTYPSGHLFNIQFSHLPGMFSANENIRKAVSLVIDKDELVNRIVASPGTRIADSMFHDWLTVDNKIFVRERPPTPHHIDMDAARAHMVEARKELGLDTNAAIKLSLTINDSDLYRRIAEYLQQQLSNLPDVELVIDPQMTQIMVDKWRKGSSDMTLITWPVDVDDPMDQISFMGNPDFRTTFQGLYRGKDMADLYFRNRDAITIDDRLDAIEAVQQLFESKVTVMPLFESYGASTTNKKLRGFVWQPVRGYPDFRYARIVR